MANNTRLPRIVEYMQKEVTAAIQAQPERASSVDYRWKHTLRVTQYGRQLAEAESANIELCMAACLLHDVAKFSRDQHDVDHGRMGAKIARPLLLELGYAPADVENMCFGIAWHVDGKSDFDHPETIEAKVISDADNIDRFSAYRILLQFRKHLDDFDALISQAKVRIGQLKDYREKDVLLTQTGNHFFNYQLDLQITFLERLVADGRLTVIPDF